MYEAAELERDAEVQQEKARDDSVRKLVESAPVCAPEAHGADVHAVFEADKSAEGVVVVDSGKPVGLVMRNDFYQRLGTTYGRSLYLRRPIRICMNNHPLIVDVDVDVADISRLAMNRPTETLYDLVVMTEGGTHLGVVSIKNFMIELSNKREREIDLLKQQREILQKANAAESRHRRQMEEKNVELRARNDAVKNLLDNAGQGFLSFGADLVVFEELSLECVKLFHENPAGKSILKLLSRHAPEELRGLFTQVFESVFKDEESLKQKVYLSLLPSEIAIFDRIVRLEYKLLAESDVKKLMLVMTDVTDKKELERRMEEERANLRMIVKALSNQADLVHGLDDFKTFFSETAPAIIESQTDPDVALAELYRAVHTYKGDFGQMYLTNTAKNLHEIEDALSKMQEADVKTTTHELAAFFKAVDVESIIERDVLVLTEVLGEGFFAKDERLLVSVEAILHLETRLQTLPVGKERDEMLAELRKLRRHNVKELLQGVDEYIRSLAERLDKPVDLVRIEGEDVFIEKAPHQAFFKSLVHVYRNMVDHGVETYEERVDLGKSEFARISLTLANHPGDAWSLTIADDGRGIDPERIQAKAAEKGLIPPDATLAPEQAYEMLFQDAFSTKDEISLVSGRGVGLAAVRAEVEKLGGRVMVSSKTGQGSSFSFRIPALN